MPNPRNDPPAAEASSRPRVLLISRHKASALSAGGRSLLPHSEADIHLVTHPYGGADGLDPADFIGLDVCDFIPGAEVEALCRRRLDEGRFSHVVAVHEKMLMFAAQLRHDYGLPGMDPATTALFRDKVLMKERLAARGVAEVPRFHVLDRIEDLAGIDWSTGPKVIKHRHGLGASEVHIVDSLTEATDLVRSLELASGNYEVEDYIDGPVYHCDAIILNGRVVFSAASEYISTAADYRRSGLLGSVTVTDPTITAALTTLNERVLSALGIRDGVTHLEAIQRSDGAMVFCEVAGRPGGAAVDRALEALYGINITQIAYRIQCGLPVTLLDTIPSPGDRAAGWVLFYPSSRHVPPVDHRTRARLGITETFGEHAVEARQPRHCTDYACMYVLTAPTRTRLLHSVAELAGRHLAG
jgi:ATP-grasp domain